jgi:NADH-quinone oxidoreductase subunit G
VEELYLLQKVMHGLGSGHVESRLRQVDTRGAAQLAWLGMSVAEINHLKRVLVIGSHLRKDQPLLAARIRTATKHGLEVYRLDAGGNDWLMPVAAHLHSAPAEWVKQLTEIAIAIAKAKSLTLPAGAQSSSVSAPAQRIADQLLAGANLENPEKQAILLGALAIAHPNASDLHILAEFIAHHTGACLGFLGEGGNAVGAQVVGATQGNHGSVESLLQSNARAYVLMNLEPLMDLPNPQQTRAALTNADTVIALSAFTSPDLLELADVILPITPYTETVSTYINMAAQVQTIQPAVRPLADARPAWKVLRAMGSLLNLDGFLYNVPEEVLADALAKPLEHSLSNSFTANAQILNKSILSGLIQRLADQAIYASDAIVRRAPSLQLTRDAKMANQIGVGEDLFEQLGLKEGDLVIVSQEGKSLEALVTLQPGLAGGVVRIAVGTGMSTQFGSMFGEVTITKVAVTA